MTKAIACNSVIEGCAWQASAATETELVQKVTAHAAESTAWRR